MPARNPKGLEGDLEEDLCHHMEIDLGLRLSLFAEHCLPPRSIPNIPRGQKTLQLARKVTLRNICCMSFHVAGGFWVSRMRRKMLLLYPGELGPSPHPGLVHEA